MNYQTEYYRSLIESTNGKFFSVQFIKKDGTVRNMVARTGVTVGVKGTGHPVSQEAMVIRIWDVQKKAFRCIPLNRINFIKFRGIVHTTESRLAA